MNERLEEALDHQFREVHELLESLRGADLDSRGGRDLLSRLRVAEELLAVLERQAERVRERRSGSR